VAPSIDFADFTLRDLTGLAEFHLRHPEYRPLVIGEERYRDAAVRAGMDFIRWQDYLLDGLPRNT
jgi:hypothetical protein